MYDKSPAYAPDLEWLLQSGQATDEVLARALVERHFPRLYRKALDDLIYPEEARRAVDETLVTAILNAHRFRAETSVTAWLDGIADPIRQRRLTDQSGYRFLNPRLRDAMLRRPPARELSVQELEQATSRLLNVIEAQRAARRRNSTWQELILASLAILLVFLLARFSGVLPDIPGLTQTATPTLTEPRPAPTRENPAATPFRQPGILSPGSRIIPLPPLSLQSSHEDIWRRLLMNRYLWHTRWSDVWIILYGPRGYRGPMRAEHHQLWIDHDRRGLLISGPMGGNPDHVELITPDSLGPEPTIFLQGVNEFARLGGKLTWSYLSTETILSSPFMYNIFSLAHQDWPPQEDEYIPVQEGIWADDRRVLVVDRLNREGHREALLWLDTITGTILREQYFGESARGEVLLDVIVTAIAFDKELPEFVFDPGQNQAVHEHFARDYTAGSFQDTFEFPQLPDVIPYAWEPLPLVGAPPGYDPSQAQLTFQWVLIDPSIKPGWRRDYYVFADDYVLGSIALANPFNMICDRSPDGRRIAFASLYPQQEIAPDIIHWFELADLQLQEHKFPGDRLVRFAFAPDSRQLAVSAFDQSTSSGKIYVLDTSTNETTTLGPIEGAWGLAWSPDGRQLATLLWPSTRESDESAVQVVVFDLNKGTASKVHTPTEPDWGRISIEIPLEGWVARFALPMGGLESCTAPPGIQSTFEELATPEVK